MRFHKELYLVILGTFLFFTLVLNESRELEGYKFPVYSTPFCPRNESEWNKRSAALNCNRTNGFTCLPNQQFTELLEFCYTQPRILIEGGICLYLVKGVSKVNGYNCHHFSYGCPNAPFLSDRIFDYPGCISLGTGCFLAEPSCESGKFPYLPENGSINIKEDVTITNIHPQQSTEETNTSTNDREKLTLLAILLGTIIPICVLFVLCGYFVFHKRPFPICKKHGDVKSLEVRKSAQSTEQPELIHIDQIDKEIPVFKRKPFFKSDEDEEMEPLIHEIPHAGENSERHEVEMLPPLLAKNKNMACQISDIYGKKSSLESGEKEKINQSIYDNQHVDGNAENHEGEILASPMEKNRNITYQGFQVCTTNGGESLTAVPSEQLLENYQPDTALIEEVLCTYQRKSALGHDEEEKFELFIDDNDNQHIRENAENCKGEMLSQRLKKNKNMIYQESLIEKTIFDDWNQEDSCFVFTKACEEVEKLIKSKNLVIVAGHSGSGKSAIIQHIALLYRKQGWAVKRVKEVKDIVDEYSSSRFQKNKTICVFNDPLGKESFDEMLNNSWQTYEEELKSYLKTAKLMMSCRNYIISDSRVKRYLIYQSVIVDVDSDKNKLSFNEKRQILTKYTSDMNLSTKESDKIVEVERFFPLLCKLYSNKHVHDIAFFTEPIKVLEEEIRGFRKKDKEKYCALVLLVLFNNDLCVNNLLENEELEKKYKHTLKLCGLPESTPPFAILDSIESLKGFFVKKIDDRYHFHHDFVMEVTTHVLGTDYPVDLIKHADIGFIRRRVKLGNCNEKNDTFLIHLSDRHVEKLAKRLFIEMIGPRFLDVVLNPCLRDEKVIKALRKIIEIYQVHLEMVLKNKELNIDKEVLDSTSKNLLLSKLSFLKLQTEVSPLFALIVFCHTELSMHCLNTLKQMQAKVNLSSLFPAVCCNGSLSMFETFSKDNMTIWHGVPPIFIVSVFHNYEILEKLIENGENVNLTIDTYRSWTPLMLASGNDCNENEINNHGISSETRRNKTVEILLKNGAYINSSCTKHGDGPLFLACQNGYDSTVNLLLSKKPNINVCTNNGSSPLFIACQNGHDRTVHLLLSNGADINLCSKKGASPLYTACQNGHDSTVQLLLSNGADIDLCTVDGASPIYVACLNGHDATAKLLLSYGADINMCIKDELSALFAACHQGHESTVKLLLRNGANINLCRKGTCSPLDGACYSGQENIVNILLRNGADINLCNENGISALYSACLLGHDNTIKVLLSNGAIVNLCKNNGTSPLTAACFKGHDSTVQLLLNNKADINLCSKHGTSSLYIACQKGHYSIVQLLLSNGADISLCCIDGFGPLYTACENGYDSIVQLLLRNGADINFCSKDNSSPLYAACKNGHDITAQLLLSNGADVNLCTNDNNISPLYVACCNGHFDTVQLLLSKGASTNLCSQDGESPLYAACVKGHNSIVQLLMIKGANVNLCTKDGTSPLSAACFTGHDSIIQNLLNNGANANLCNKNEVYPLHIACFNGQESIVQLLMDNLADVNLCMKHGISPLHVACEKGNARIVQLLITKGADIDLRNEDGTSPLLAACLSKHYNIIQLLLRNGAVTNSCNKNGTGPLYVACFHGHDEVANLLLNSGANINSCAKDGSSPLFVACFNGHYGTVQLLLGNGADINLSNKNGHGPLYAACFSGYENTTQLLLNNGANINEGMETGESLLHCCLENDAIVQLLLKNGANINFCKESKASPICSDCYRRHDSIPSPLYGACVKGQYNTAKLLISMGADINLCLEDGISPLFAACKNKNATIVQLLLSNGADVNLSRRDGCSPLHEACKTGHAITVQLLLKNGANVNSYIRQYMISPLFIACVNGYVRIAELLLNNGAETNSCTTDGTSILYYACAKGHDKIVQLLLSNGADINLSKDGTPSPLFVACQNRHDSIVDLLLRNGADINLSDRNRAGPLFVACLKAHESTVKILLKNGADINFCLTNGVSPLYSACNEGHDDIVQLLLCNGADINSCDKDGLSPIYVACLKGHDSTVQFLLSNGADINLRMRDGVSPLYIAFEARRYKTVSILLNNGVDTSLACGWEVNPSLVGCFDENDSTVKFLQQNDNIINNMHDSDSYFSLFVSCQVERVTRMTFDPSYFFIN